MTTQRISGRARPNQPVIAGKATFTAASSGATSAPASTTASASCGRTEVRPQPARLVRLHTGPLHHPAPQRMVRADLPVQLLRRAGRWGHAERADALLHVGHAEDAHESRIQLI